MTDLINLRDNTFDPEIHPTLDRENVAAALLAHGWQFAKTMPLVPHWYTLRKNWNDPNLPWENVVQFLRDDGRKGRYLGGRGRLGLYWVHDGMRYWTMGDRLRGTILINRDEDVPRDYFRWE